jgi:APA family basic amino acid/polyamine antiporter
MNGAPLRQLTLLDSICLIVGIIVGVGIYQVAPDVAKGSQSSWSFMAVWLVAGLLSLCGALAYAELATAYPQEGGDYAYLTRAYGPWAGFLFGWIQLVIVRPGDIAVMAFAFATYAATLHEPAGPAAPSHVRQLYACLAVAALTAVNILGVRQGKWAQNLLTLAKVAGLVAVVAVAFAAQGAAPPPAASSPLPLSLAMILALFTFGGWNEMAYVAAEVVNPRRNIARALVLGTLAVTLLYLLVNGAFLYALGYSGVKSSAAVAVDTVRTVFPNQASLLISILICVSALGAVNGLIFAGARISYATGRDHRVFRPLGNWDPATGTPVRALLLQGIIAITLIGILGSFLNTILYTAAAVYLFYMASNLAVIVLRYKEPHVERPFRVWGYPFPPLIFSATCAFLAYSAVIYKPAVAASALALLLLGLPVYWFSRRAGKPAASQPSSNP